ncbi:DUF4129 domain-containing protein [Paramicrobacterium agarici]|uniref:Uncharacterized protein DUF4129 n=1 Tax=Paramicrobacterium agarici TaxID=630514 RepID=A0A2A9DXN9_9MICO|nr:DUF4129 domain-containing protein [Microbacterium agarici]PFG31353.1 uncharacterized protein DUF4129 [Microbacterium agarici]
MHRARVDDDDSGMRRRLLLPVVVACAVAIVLITAVQGPVLFGKPRLELIVPRVESTITSSPERSAPDTDIPPNPDPGSNGLLNPLSILIALGALVAAALVTVAFLIARAARRRKRLEPAHAGVSALPVQPTDHPQPESVDIAPELARGIERALGVLDTHADPQNAVIEAWLGLQQSAEDSGFHLRPSETPAEFTVRVLARDQSIAADLRTLLDLYQDVRFGDRRATASDIGTARTSLLAIQKAWA